MLVGTHFIPTKKCSFKCNLIVTAFFHGLQVEVYCPRHSDGKRNDPNDGHDPLTDAFTHWVHRVANGQASFHRDGHQRVYRSVHRHPLKVRHEFAYDQSQTPLCKNTHDKNILKILYIISIIILI